MPAASSEECEQRWPITTRTPAATSSARGLDRLVQAAGVVGGDQADLLAEHAAALVESADRHLYGDPVARAGQRVGSGQRIGEADLDLGRGVAGHPEHERGDQQAEKAPAHHESPSGARLPAAIRSGRRRAAGGKTCSP